MALDAQAAQLAQMLGINPQILATPQGVQVLQLLVSKLAQPAAPQQAGPAPLQAPPGGMPMPPRGAAGSMTPNAGMDEMRRADPYQAMGAA